MGDAPREKTRPSIREALQRPVVRAGICGLLVSIGAVCVFSSELVARLTFYDALNDQAVELIDDALVRDQVTFLGISAIKASLAMIEGSSVGIGFELQVGDIVQPAYDYVDFFWRVFLYAFLVMGFYKLLLETHILYLGIALGGIGLILLGVGLVSRFKQADLLLFGRRCFLIGILVAYVAPLSLILTDTLSTRYTSGIRAQHYETITAFGDELDTAKAKFLALRTQFSLLRPGESLEEVKVSLLAIANSVGESFQLSLMAFLFYVLVILFDLLVFPLISALVLYKFTVFALGRLLERPPPAILAAPAE